MKKVKIDDVELTEKMLKELGRWYENPDDSEPSKMVGFITDAKDLLIRLMCNGTNDEYIEDFKTSLTGLLLIEDNLKQMVPE